MFAKLGGLFSWEGRKGCRRRGAQCRAAVAQPSTQPRSQVTGRGTRSMCVGHQLHTAKGLVAKHGPYDSRKSQFQKASSRPSRGAGLGQDLVRIAGAWLWEWAGGLGSSSSDFSRFSVRAEARGGRPSRPDVFRGWACRTQAEHRRCMEQTPWIRAVLGALSTAPGNKGGPQATSPCDTHR